MTPSRSSKKVRVLQVLPRFTPFGAERMVFHFARHHTRDRVEMAVASLFPPNGTDLEAQLLAEGHTIFYIGKRLGFDPRVYLRFHELLGRFRPDVVHTHLYIMRYVVPPALLRRVPLLVHTVHSEPAQEARLLGGLGELLARLAFRSGVVPVALTPDVVPKLVAMYGLAQDPPVIPNGIPVEQYDHPTVPRGTWRKREGFAATDVLLLIVARLNKEKNHVLLIEAFARGLAAHPRAHLLVAGEGEELPNLQRQVATAGLQEKVHFLGQRNDVPDLLAAADVFVLSSAWEGNPLSVMEAMSAGRPIVSTRVGALPDLVDDGVHGLLVPAGDAALLAEALKWLVEHAAERWAMGRAAADRARERFGVEAMVKAYEGLYAARLGRPPL